MVILSIDGGASRTRGVLFTEGGVVSVHRETEATSLSRADADAEQLLGLFVAELADQSGLGIEGVDLVNVGVAGVSNQDARERLLKELDALGVSDRSLVTSDVEAAYETVWGTAPGVLVCVGTGAIGWARDSAGQTFRASGRGPQLGGDPGGGYWLGKQAMVQLIMNERASDEQLDELRDRITAASGADNFDEAARLMGAAENMVAATALLGKTVCVLAEEGNEAALAMVQEGTRSLADDLLGMIEEAGLRQDSMVIGMHGAVIENSPLFRRLLAESLCYDVPAIEWRAPEIDPVFGAGLMACRLHEVEVDLAALKHNWSERLVRTSG